jgi:hypothetical protein
MLKVPNTMVKTLKQFVKKANLIVIRTHDCGFFDGACHTLAYTIHSYFEGTRLFHISRTAERRDHSVVYFPTLDKYFDADGFQTAKALFTKMEEVEGVTCTALLPFDDFDAHKRVFIDTYLVFTEMLKKTQLATPN